MKELTKAQRTLRELRVVEAGLDEHYRLDPIVHAGIRCYLAGELEWDELLIQLVKKLAVDHERVTKRLLEFEMKTPSWAHPK